jgi:hypothetical protein
MLQRLLFRPQCPSCGCPALLIGARIRRVQAAPRRQDRTAHQVARGNRARCAQTGLLLMALHLSETWRRVDVFVDTTVPALARLRVRCPLIAYVRPCVSVCGRHAPVGMQLCPHKHKCGCVHRPARAHAHMCVCHIRLVCVSVPLCVRQCRIVRLIASVWMCVRMCVRVGVRAFAVTSFHFSSVRVV